MSARNLTPRTRGGLTILEIIVLLVVLIILAAVLFPMFARTGHGEARKSTCQSNLKECAVGLHVYTNDYDGCLPSSALVRGSKRWNERDFAVFAGRAGRSPQTPRGWAQLTYRYMRATQYRDGYAYCPSDESAEKSSGTHTSYWWKAAVDKAWYGVGCSKPYRRMNDFGYCADQVILYERAGFHHRCPQGLRNSVRINVAYLDTHVKNVGLTNSLPATGRRWVTSPTAPGEPAYYNFDNSKPKKDSVNPPSPQVGPTHTDPSRYSDMLP